MDKPYQPTDATQAGQAAAALTTLPSLEDTYAQLQTAVVELGRQITGLAPAVSYEWRREDSRSGCAAPYEQSDGEQILLRNYVSDTPIPEQSWQQAYRLAEQTATSLGAHAVTVFKDEPGNHDVQFSNDTGTTLRIGSQAAALITGSTGCRLPRGADAPGA